MPNYFKILRKGRRIGQKQVYRIPAAGENIFQRVIH